MKTLVFDFGAVLVDWDPHYLYDSLFGSREKAKEIGLFFTRWIDMMGGEIEGMYSLLQECKAFP